MNDIFENNKQNLLLINEIVANYRKQNFFVGSLKLSALLKNINSVVEVIFSREDCRDLAGELEQILPALLQAQGNQDYILQADILEGDLLPLLQKIQIKLQEDGTPQVPYFLESNMVILKEKTRDSTKYFRMCKVTMLNMSLPTQLMGSQPCRQGTATDVFLCIAR